ncbi:translation initiation factor IF-2-like [Manacus candei]|uniref:translation initiation factor IF-2-like n=1 Tax=Manacus candei TaxID=415023 RepID=UPI0022267809|nr:translation initiation factor IF-2-like [Manacus candei]
MVRGAARERGICRRRCCYGGRGSECEEPEEVEAEVAACLRGSPSLLSPPVCQRSRPVGRVGPRAAAATLITPSFFFFRLLGNARPGLGSGTPRPPAAHLRGQALSLPSPLLPTPPRPAAALAARTAERGRARGSSAPRPSVPLLGAAPAPPFSLLFSLPFCFPFPSLPGRAPRGVGSARAGLRPLGRLQPAAAMSPTLPGGDCEQSFGFSAEFLLLGAVVLVRLRPRVLTYGSWVSEWLSIR